MSYTLKKAYMDVINLSILLAENLSVDTIKESSITERQPFFAISNIKTIFTLGEK